MGGWAGHGEQSQAQRELLFRQIPPFEPFLGNQRKGNKRRNLLMSGTQVRKEWIRRGNEWIGRERGGKGKGWRRMGEMKKDWSRGGFSRWF